MKYIILLLIISQLCLGMGRITEDGRLLSDNVYGTRDEDAARRDLPVNALYYDTASGEVID